MVQAAGADPAVEHRQQQEVKGMFSPRKLYQQNKAAREQLSLQLLMHLNGDQMASIKASYIRVPHDHIQYVLRETA